MTKRDIVEEMAAAGYVEALALNVAHASVLTPDLQDLSQLVYLALLQYDEAKMVDLWETGAMPFFVSRVLINQYNSRNSPFFHQVREFRGMCDEISPGGYETEREEGEGNA